MIFHLNLFYHIMVHKLVKIYYLNLEQKSQKILKQTNNLLLNYPYKI